MFEMRVSSVAEQIVTHHLQAKGRENEAVYINFDVRLSYFRSVHSSLQFNSSRGLHLLYHQCPGHATLSVFSAVTPSPFDRLKDIAEWKHETSHDSCWRDVRLYTDTYFLMARQINAQIVEAGGAEVAPAEMNQYCSFAGIGRGNLFEWVPVEVTKDPNDNHKYRRIVKVNP